MRKVAFALFPYKRDQDLIKIGEYTFKHKKIPYESITDGWNNSEDILGNDPGRVVAKRVAEQFPKLFVRSIGDDLSISKPIEDVARKTADAMDKNVLSWYPAHASCVGTFIIGLQDRNIIIAVGTISTYLWNGRAWEKPNGIGDYVLDRQIYTLGSARFFGLGEFKGNSLYSPEPDTVVVSNTTPIFVATDGLIMDNSIMTIEELNEYSKKASPYQR